VIDEELPDLFINVGLGRPPVGQAGDFDIGHLVPFLLVLVPVLAQFTQLRKIHAGFLASIVICQCAIRRKLSSEDIPF
jgi:hypothetical protein